MSIYCYFYQKMLKLAGKDELKKKLTYKFDFIYKPLRTSVYFNQQNQVE